MAEYWPIEIIYNHESYPGTDIIGFYRGRRSLRSRTLDSIWLDEENFMWILPMIENNYPEFEFYDLDNPIPYDVWQRILVDIKHCADLIEKDIGSMALQPYIDRVRPLCHETDSSGESIPVLGLPALIAMQGEVVSFLREFSDWISKQMMNKRYRFINVEGL